MAKTTADTIKNLPGNSTPKNDKRSAFFAIGAGVLLLIIIITAYFVTTRIFSGDSPYEQAMKQADEATSNSNSAAFIRAAKELESKIDSFDKDSEKATAYRKVGSIYDTSGNAAAALSAYKKAEAINQTKDLALSLRIGRLAETTGDNQLAIKYYNLGISIYDSDPKKYPDYPAALIDGYKKAAASLEGQK